jgi:hypothetical protein
MWVGLRRIDRQKGFERPPLLCFGLEDPFAESFTTLSALVDEVQKAEKQHKLIKTEGWRAFPLPKRDSGRLGVNRFGPEDLMRWEAAHPAPRQPQP